MAAWIRSVKSVCWMPRLSAFFLILSLFLRVAAPSLAFRDMRLLQPYRALLEERGRLSSPGAYIFRISDEETVVVGVGQGFIEGTDRARIDRAVRSASIMARSSLVQRIFGEEVQAVRTVTGKQGSMVHRQELQSVSSAVLRRAPVVGSWKADDGGAVFVAVGFVVRDGRVAMDAAGQRHEPVEIRLLEGEEPFVTLLRHNFTLALYGGAEGFVLPGECRVLLVSGKALLSAGPARARRIARLRAVKELLARRDGITIVCVERLSEGEVVETDGAVVRTNHLSEFMEVHKEEVSGVINAMPVVAVWQDPEGEHLYVAMGKEFGCNPVKRTKR